MIMVLYELIYVKNSEQYLVHIYINGGVFGYALLGFSFKGGLDTLASRRAVKGHFQLSSPPEIASVIEIHHTSSHALPRTAYVR